jgi:hypothetical protein
MAERMRRTQILFPEDEYRHLQKVAQERQCSVGHLVREAVTQQYLDHPRQQRAAAARRLVQMGLPVGDWPEMEREIERGSTGG